MSKNLTIIAASDIKINETIYALIKSTKYIKPYKTILFSSNLNSINKKNIERFNFIEHIKIKPLNSLSDYSNFIIYELCKYINTSHILIVQWDGYVINPAKWSDDFLNYDYVGAPFIPRFSDYSYSRDKDNNFFVVGNGGFSLRSKKLLKAPTKFKLIDDQEITNSHEDGFFCILHRKFLESKGFKWANFKIASRFSIESPINLNEILDLPFGFHGKKIILFIKLIKFISKIKKFLAKKIST